MVGWNKLIIKVVLGFIVPGGSEKTMSSLAGSSFQRSVAFDLTISDERHSSSSSSSSSSDDGENGEHTREEQKVLEKVETPTKEGNNQLDQSHSLENKGDYCDKTTTINKSCTSDDKSEIAPTDHKEKVRTEEWKNRVLSCVTNSTRTCGWTLKGHYLLQSQIYLPPTFSHDLLVGGQEVHFPLFSFSKNDRLLLVVLIAVLLQPELK